ncbi:Heavy metal RND efflux outer membrane protein, CzcC family [hydrothermal vent metagenome]|uniref:Heavy metal RND efflux outer membrane protein, CzcC family n=1 Tax=hydrothermal vent metagenome TaxID=652676 RepID=A0A3B1A726_9ZZZZ
MYFQLQYRIPSLRQLSVLCLLSLAISTAQAAEPLSLDNALTAALSTNPGLAAIEARVEALAEIPDQFEALPDPVLSVNLLNLPLDSFSFTQEGMTQLQVGIVQALPFPGKLALRSQVAQHQVGAAEADVAEWRLQLARDVKTLWWNIFYLDRALEVIARNQVLLKQFVNVAETRYTVGRGLQQDILLAQLELSKLGDSMIRVENRRENEAVRLNVLMNHPAADPVQLPHEVDEQLRKSSSSEVLLERAKTTRPKLQAQTERMSAARSRIELEKKGYAPNFKVGAMYGLRGGSNPDGSRRSDFGSIVFSMNLPIYTGSKQDRAVDQRNAEWIQQKYQLHDQQNLVASQVQQAITDYRWGGEQTRLFQQEIIPQARQTVDAMLAGYQVGKVDFLSLIRAQTTLYDYETQYWKALSAANQAMARLVAAVGDADEEHIYE